AGDVAGMARASSERYERRPATSACLRHRGRSGCAQRVNREEPRGLVDVRLGPATPAAWTPLRLVDVRLGPAAPAARTRWHLRDCRRSPAVVVGIAGDDVACGV